jgi:large subunit ribosomal protein L9
LPRGKALRATADNKTRFEGMKSELTAKNLEMKGEAGKVASKIDGKTYVVIRQASEGGQLFGSVSTRDIAALLNADGAEIGRSQVSLNAPIKAIGAYKVPLALHPEVEVSITVTVARSEDEAERIARGENVLIARTDEEEQAAAALANAETFFEPGAGEGAKDDEPAEAQAEGEAAKPADKPARKPRKKAEAEVKADDKAED